MTTNLIASKLERSLRQLSQPSEIPKGFRRAEEFQKIWGVKRAWFQKLVKSHAAAGRIERKNFRAKDRHGRIRGIWFFRAVK